MKISKKICTILTLTIIITVLFTQTPNVNASQETVKEKVLSALRNVSGINVDKYTINVTNYRAAPRMGYEEKYRGEEEIALTLESKESKLFVTAFYLNNQLCYVYTYIIEGSSSTVHYINRLPDDPLSASKEVLSRLQTFTGNPSIADMKNILEPAKTNADLTNKTVGNIKFKASLSTNPFEQHPSPPLREMYFMNTAIGAETPQSISLHFEPDGFFMGFSDRWSLYTVGSAKVNVSREQAISIAYEQANSAAGSASIDFPSNRPVFAELRMAVRGDGLELYPYWFVEVPLVYSVDLSFNAWQLTIWADTGEIASSHPTGGYGSASDMDSGSSVSSGLSESSDANVFLSDADALTSQFYKRLFFSVVVIIAVIAIIGLIMAVHKKR